MTKDVLVVRAQPREEKVKEGGRERRRKGRDLDLPMPVATARAKEAMGSFWSSFSSNIKFLMSALGRGVPTRREYLAGSPPCWGGGGERGREGGRERG